MDAGQAEHDGPMALLALVMYGVHITPMRLQLPASVATILNRRAAGRALNLTRILLGQDTIGIAEVAVIRRQIADKDSLARPASSRAQGSILIQSHYSTWEKLDEKGSKAAGASCKAINN